MSNVVKLAQDCKMLTAIKQMTLIFHNRKSDSIQKFSFQEFGQKVKGALLFLFYSYCQL